MCIEALCLLLRRAGLTGQAAEDAAPAGAGDGEDSDEDLDCFQDLSDDEASGQGAFELSPRLLVHRQEFPQLQCMGAMIRGIDGYVRMLRSLPASLAADIANRCLLFLQETSRCTQVQVLEGRARETAGLRSLGLPVYMAGSHLLALLLALGPSVQLLVMNR